MTLVFFIENLAIVIMFDVSKHSPNKGMSQMRIVFLEKTNYMSRYISVCAENVCIAPVFASTKCVTPYMYLIKSLVN